MMIEIAVLEIVVAIVLSMQLYYNFLEELSLLHATTKERVIKKQQQKMLKKQLTTDSCFTCFAASDFFANINSLFFIAFGTLPLSQVNHS
jgi:hypothetical protein